MTRSPICCCLLLWTFLALLSVFSVRSADYLHLFREEGQAAVVIEGKDDDDWYLERSTDLKTWQRLAEFGTLLSGRVNAPARHLQPASGPQFFRALKTKGLYDTNLFRRIDLTFTNSAWQNALNGARTRQTNVPAALSMNNGAYLFNVGARYKGNTSFTMSATKKSINLEINYTNASARLMGYKTVNLNNAAGDETIMREPLYFNIMRQYVPCPRGSMAMLYINGQYWGVYSLIEQENSDLIRDWFPSTDGDRWRTPNAPAGGAGFSGGSSAFSYLGTNLTSYRAHYELKTDNSTNAWQRLTNAIALLNLTPASELRDKAETVFAVDSWLWFLALENVLADDDSYWNKGADYGFYYEPESGRIHPVQHDGNEAFTAGDVSLSPVTGATGTNRPLLSKFLGIPELRQRYLAHIRTILDESFHPEVMAKAIEHFHRLSIEGIIADTRKGYTMAAYTNDLRALQTWVTTRHRYLTNHAELTPRAPKILAVHPPVPVPAPTQGAAITAQVDADGTNGVDSVWLYWRDKTYGVFDRAQMFDDGAHGDGEPNDGVFGGQTAAFPAGHKIHFYVEARSANPAKAAVFSPRRAEKDAHSYRVGLASAPYTPVVINEIMAQNRSTITDPQGEFDDWIELRNLTSQPVDLTGRYLSDEPRNPRKWQFPPGTVIPAEGYLIVWADENGKAPVGLHASFKLAAEGESLFLADIDANHNAVLDSVTWGPQTADISYGRSSNNADEWTTMVPTPGAANN